MPPCAGLSQATVIGNVAPARTPSVAPVSSLVTLRVPKTATVWLVTVTVAVPPGGTFTRPDVRPAYVGAPQTWAGSRFPAGSTSVTVHPVLAGTVTVLVASRASVTWPEAVPQSHRTVKCSAAPPVYPAPSIVFPIVSEAVCLMKKFVTVADRSAFATMVTEVLEKLLPSQASDGSAKSPG